MAKEWDQESANAADIPKKEDSWNVQPSLAEEESDGINHKIEENAEDIKMSENGEEEGSSYSQVKKVLSSEDLEEFNSSIAAACPDRTKGKEKVVDETLRRTTEMVEEDGPSDSALDPLEAVEEAALKLYEYINHMFSVLEAGLRDESQDLDKLDLSLRVDQDGLKDEFQDLVSLDLSLRVDHLHQTLAQKIEKVTGELLSLKNDENRKEGFPQVLIQLMDLDIPERLTRSFELWATSLCRKRCTTVNELSSCKDELNQSKDELLAIILMARELKKKEMASKCTGESSNRK